jgi:hypothetical protein
MPGVVRMLQQQRVAARFGEPKAKADENDYWKKRFQSELR